MKTKFLRLKDINVKEAS